MTFRTVLRHNQKVITLTLIKPTTQSHSVITSIGFQNHSEATPVDSDRKALIPEGVGIRGDNT